MSMADGSVQVIHGTNKSYGFGRAIYLSHANNYSSVYGHLDRLTDSHKLEQTYQLFSLMSTGYSFFTYFPEGYIPVQRSEQIAWSGEMGVGPAHLHFELKRGKDLFLNPLQHSFMDFADDSIPVIQYLRVYTPGITIDGKTTNRCQAVLEQRGGNTNTYRCRELLEVDGTWALKIQTYDQANAINLLGPDSITLFLEDQKKYELSLGSFLRGKSANEAWMSWYVFDSTYSGFSPVRYTYNLYWPQKANLASFVSFEENKGWFDASSWALGETRNVYVRVKDGNGNTAVIRATVKKVRGTPVQGGKGVTYNLAASKAHRVQHHGVTISVPKQKVQSWLRVSSSQAPHKSYLKNHSRLYSVSYGSAGSAKPAEFAMRATYTRRKGLYYRNGRPVSKFSYDWKRKVYVTELKRSAEIFLAEDISSPSFGTTTLNGPLEQILFELPVKEIGSGIDTGKIDLYLDGVLLSDTQKVRFNVYYDNDRKSVLMNTGHIYPYEEFPAGKLHSLWVQVYDKAGNKSPLWQGYTHLRY